MDDALALTNLLRWLGWFERMAIESPEVTYTLVARHLEKCGLADGSHSAYIAKDGNREIVGHISIRWLPYLFLPGLEGFISELFVRDDARGRGVGGGLLEAVTQEAKERRCYRLSLLNGSQRESYQRKFYQKQGWEERPTMVNFVKYMS